MALCNDCKTLGYGSVNQKEIKFEMSMMSLEMNFFLTYDYYLKNGSSNYIGVFLNNTKWNCY